MTVAPERTQVTPPSPPGVSRAWMWGTVAATITAVIAIAVLWIGNGDRAEGKDIAGSGTMATRSFDVGEFSRIQVNSEAEIDLTQGSQTYVEVTTDQNLIEYLDISVSNDSLVIDTTDEVRDLDPTDGIRYRITTPAIDELRVHGVATIEGGSIETGELEIFVSGAANVDIADLDTDTFITRSTGVSTIKISGTAASQEIRWTGAGNLVLGDLESMEADITATGAGSITVWVSDRLDVRSTGATDVRYFGTPEINSTVTGVGGLRSLGEK